VGVGGWGDLCGFLGEIVSGVCVHAGRTKEWKGSVLQCVTVCCSVLQCVLVSCSVLQCVAVCCDVLQCVAVCCSA